METDKIKRALAFQVTEKGERSIASSAERIL